jgi:hypothetical protein
MVFCKFFVDFGMSRTSHLEVNGFFAKEKFTERKTVKESVNKLNFNPQKG